MRRWIGDHFDALDLGAGDASEHLFEISVRHGLAIQLDRDVVRSKQSHRARWRHAYRRDAPQHVEHVGALRGRVVAKSVGAPVNADLIAGLSDDDNVVDKLFFFGLSRTWRGRRCWRLLRMRNARTCYDHSR